MARIVAAIALPAYYRGRIAEVEGWLEEFDETELERYPAVAVTEAGCTRSADDRPRPSAGSPPPSAGPTREGLRSSRRSRSCTRRRAATAWTRCASTSSSRSPDCPRPARGAHGIAAARLHVRVPRARRSRRRDSCPGRGVGRAAERDRYADRGDQRTRAARIRARRARRSRAARDARARARRGGGTRRLRHERARAGRVRRTSLRSSGWDRLAPTWPPRSA